MTAEYLEDLIAKAEAGDANAVTVLRAACKASLSNAIKEATPGVLVGIARQIAGIIGKQVV